MSTSRWGDRLVRYPGDLARRYRRSGLWGTRTIADELHAVATAHPQRQAVVALDGRMTYRELDESTDVLAAGLAGLGLVPGDPVLFQVTNRLGADTRVAHLIPVIHNAGVVCAVHAPHSAGACLVLGTHDLAESLPLIAKEGATHVLLGHGHFKAVAEPGFAAATASVTQVVLSGAKVPPALFGDLEQRGLWSGQLFGMGEGLFLTTRPGAPREARATTVGTPLSPMDEIRILEPGSATELPDGQVGELCCRGPYTVPGYFDAAEHNARAFTPDGFYRTGDLASVREIGGGRYVSIEGRIKDVINRGGEKVNAEEVELVLLRHPRITGAAAVAMPDPRLGERTCAYLVVDGEPLTMADIREHFRQLQVATFKWPERIEHLTEIPRTVVGKLDKKLLQADIAAKIAAERADLQSRS